MNDPFKQQSHWILQFSTSARVDTASINKQQRATGSKVTRVALETSPASVVLWDEPRSCPGENLISDQSDVERLRGTRSKY